MQKIIDQAFGKQVYLLGIDANKIKYWLEAPRWECGWYWGFGYIETYEHNRKPSTAHDINSHQHADGKYLPGNAAGTGEHYNDDDNLFSGGFLKDTTFNEADKWQLRELFAQFYHLKEQAAFYGRGGMHIATIETRHALIDKAQEHKINTQMIPMVIKNILQLLSPDDSYISTIDQQTELAKTDSEKQ